MSSGFAAWALDSRRSREERFGVELFVERTMAVWRNKHGLPQNHNFEAAALRRKERALNPAYEPELSRTAVERIAEVAGEIKRFDSGFSDDRPLRDISLLRFFPALEELHILRSQVRDWSPLVALPVLKTLWIMDEAAWDFRAIAELAGLKSLHLRTRTPWPDLSGFERLTALEDFLFSGNILALNSIPRLSTLRQAKFEHGAGVTVPLRRVSDLPEMPDLRRFYLENTWRLDGIERYEQLLNLEVFGYFDDLTPLSALKCLTHVTVSGGEYRTLAPLVMLPQLRRVVIRREEPQDFTPLAESPRLHEIRAELCPVKPAELAAMNAMLEPWESEFAVATPRPLLPLRLVICEYKRREVPVAAEDRNWGDDHEMATSEGRWFAREVNRRLTALLGKGWGSVSERCCSRPGTEHLTITRPEDIDRLPEIVECLRSLLAITRYPWMLYFCVDNLERFERDMDEIKEEGEEEFDVERERKEWEYHRERQRERREYLEREYRYRLQQEQGRPTRPQDFAPPAPPEAEENDAVVAGNLAREKPEYDLGTELNVNATLTEKAFYINDEDKGLSEFLLEIKAEQ